MPGGRTEERQTRGSGYASRCTHPALAGLGWIPRRKRSALQAGSLLAAGPGLAASGRPGLGSPTRSAGERTAPGTRDSRCGTGGGSPGPGLRWDRLPRYPPSPWAPGEDGIASVGSCSRVARVAAVAGEGERGRRGKRSRERASWERKPRRRDGSGRWLQLPLRQPSFRGEQAICRPIPFALQLWEGRNNRTIPDQLCFSLRCFGIALAMCCAPLGKLLTLSGLQFPFLWFLVLREF